MYGWLDPRIIGAIAAAAAFFMGGWFANGWRWDAKYSAREADYAKSALIAEQQARKSELALREFADKESQKKDAELENIRAELDSVVNELRKRPSRVPNSAAVTQGANGAQLSREDAEFLARESARADEAVIALRQCYGLYSKAREQSLE